MWNPNPIFQCGDGSQHDVMDGLEKGKWYFWYETWDEVSGPYDTKDETIEALEKYMEVL